MEGWQENECRNGDHWNIMQKTEKIQDWMKMKPSTQKGEHSALQMRQKEEKLHKKAAKTSFCSVLCME